MSNVSISVFAAPTGTPTPVAVRRDEQGFAIQQVQLDLGVGATSSPVTLNNPLPSTARTALSSGVDSVTSTGDVPHGMPNWGNPLLMGARADDANPVLVDAGARTHLRANRIGVLMVGASQDPASGGADGRGIYGFAGRQETNVTTVTPVAVGIFGLNVDTARWDRLHLNASGSLKIDGSASAFPALSSAVDSVTAAGDVPHGMPNVGNPVLIGAVADDTNPTLVDAHSRVYLRANRLGVLTVGVSQDGADGGADSRGLFGFGGRTSTNTTAINPVATGIFGYNSGSNRWDRLHLNSSGSLNVDGSGVVQPVSGTFWQATQPVSGTFWQATQPVSIAAVGQQAMAASIPVVVASDQSSLTVVGPAAVGAAASGNPVRLGAIGTSATPAAVSNGQMTSVLASPLGVLLMGVSQEPANAGADAVTGVIGFGSRASTTVTLVTPVAVGNYVLNGTSWDRQRGDSTLGTWVEHRRVATSVNTPTRSADFGTVTKLSVKGSAGNVFGVIAHNNNAAARYLLLHNKATTPAASDVPLYAFLIPPGSYVSIGEAFFGQSGTNFTTGIGWAISTTTATFTDGATAGEHAVHVHYI